MLADTRTSYVSMEDIKNGPVVIDDFDRKGARRHALPGEAASHRAGHSQD